MSYMDAIALRAFEAHSMALYGAIPVAWAALSDSERAAWRAAARAVLGES